MGGPPLKKNILNEVRRRKKKSFHSFLSTIRKGGGGGGGGHRGMTSTLRGGLSLSKINARGKRKKGGKVTMAKEKELLNNFSHPPPL